MYLNEKTGRNYSTIAKTNIKLIDDLIKQGYTIENCKTVIDKKVKEWLGTENEEYLRPPTLFGEKFDSYLNQKTTFKRKYKNKLFK